MAKTKKKAASKKPAAKSSVNKSSAIRDLKAKDPDMKPKAIAETLAKQGVEVSAAFVSTVLSNSKSKSTRKSGGRGSNGAIAVNDLILAKKLSEQMGGIDRAKSALEALAQLQ